MPTVGANDMGITLFVANTKIDVDLTVTEVAGIA
jgi:hypothetical protein